jgi:hypothetical protein
MVKLYSRKKKKKEYNSEIGLSLKVYCNSMYIPIS